MTKPRRIRRIAARDRLHEQLAKLQTFIKNINAEITDEYIIYIKSKFQSSNKIEDKVRKLIDVKLNELELLKQRI